MHETGKHIYNTKPVLGCLTVKLNDNIVLQKVPLQTISLANAQMRRATQCTDKAPWECKSGEVGECRRSCEEVITRNVKPKSSDEMPVWDCDKGWVPKTQWKCSGEGEEAMCTQKCFRILHDSFTTEGFRCKPGFFFDQYLTWQCKAGKCKRPCKEHFRHFQRVLDPSTFLFLEDYRRSGKDNEISLHYGPCGHENVGPMKVLGVTLQTEVISQNGYAVFGDRRTGRLGAAVANDTKAMHLGESLLSIGK